MRRRRIRARRLARRRSPRRRWERAPRAAPARAAAGRTSFASYRRSASATTGRASARRPLTTSTSARSMSASVCVSTRSVRRARSTASLASASPVATSPRRACNIACAPRHRTWAAIQLFAADFSQMPAKVVHLVVSPLCVDAVREPSCGDLTPYRPALPPRGTVTNLLVGEGARASFPAALFRRQ
jgi:hypothetical protein